MDSSKKGSMVVAIDSLIVGFGMAFALVIFNAPTAMVSMIVEGNEEDGNGSSSSSSDSVSIQKHKNFIETVLQISGAVLIIFLMFNILLIMMLYTGINHKSITKLWTWYIVNCILTAIIIFETLTIGGYWGFQELFQKIPNLFIIIYRIFTIHIIRKLIFELKSKPVDPEIQLIKCVQPDDEICTPHLE